MAALTLIDSQNASILFPSSLVLHAPTITVQTGDIICAFVHVFASSITNISIADSQGNTWNQGAYLTNAVSGSPDQMSVRIGYTVASADGTLTVDANMTGTTGGVNTYAICVRQFRGGSVLSSSFVGGSEYRGGTAFDGMSLSVSQTAGTHWFAGEGRNSGTFTTDTWTWPDGTTNTSSVSNQRVACGQKYVPGVVAGSVRVVRGTVDNSHIMYAMALTVDAPLYNPAQMLAVF